MVPMEAIIAGTNPLATDMIAAHLVGFNPSEFPTFTWAHKAGLPPERLDEIEIRGDSVQSVRRKFTRPLVLPWAIVRYFWATCEI